MVFRIFVYCIIFGHLIESEAMECVPLQTSTDSFNHHGYNYEFDTTVISTYKGITDVLKNPKYSEHDKIQAFAALEDLTRKNYPPALYKFAMITAQKISSDNEHILFLHIAELLKRSASGSFLPAQNALGCLLQNKDLQGNPLYKRSAQFGADTPDYTFYSSRLGLTSGDLDYYSFQKSSELPIATVLDSMKSPEKGSFLLGRLLFYKAQKSRNKIKAQELFRLSSLYLNPSKCGNFWVYGSLYAARIALLTKNIEAAFVSVSEFIQRVNEENFDEALSILDSHSLIQQLESSLESIESEELKTYGKLLINRLYTLKFQFTLNNHFFKQAFIGIDRIESTFPMWPAEKELFKAQLYGMKVQFRHDAKMSIVSMVDHLLTGINYIIAGNLEVDCLKVSIPDVFWVLDDVVKCQELNIEERLSAFGSIEKLKNKIQSIQKLHEFKEFFPF